MGVLQTSPSHGVKHGQSNRWSVHSNSWLDFFFCWINTNSWSIVCVIRVCVTRVCVTRVCVIRVCVWFVLGTQAFLLWLGALIVSYLISSTPRTYASRFSLFLLTLTFALMEFTIINYSVSQFICDLLDNRSIFPTADITVSVFN